MQCDHHHMICNAWIISFMMCTERSSPCLLRSLVMITTRVMIAMSYHHSMMSYGSPNLPTWGGVDVTERVARSDPPAPTPWTLTPLSPIPIPYLWPRTNQSPQMTNNTTKHQPSRELRFTPWQGWLQWS
mmetsp:Transcript_120596/g.209950  ORF Transcript_120596/g.209950 Transcript_120596/m.209950 type:complete len:129 (+) Transcript_120596:77-463(+)